LFASASAKTLILHLPSNGLHGIGSNAGPRACSWQQQRRWTRIRVAQRAFVVLARACTCLQTDVVRGLQISSPRQQKVAGREGALVIIEHISRPKQNSQDRRGSQSVSANAPNVMRQVFQSVRIVTQLSEVKCSHRSRAGFRHSHVGEVAREGRRLPQRNMKHEDGVNLLPTLHCVALKPFSFSVPLLLLYTHIHTLTSNEHHPQHFLSSTKSTHTHPLAQALQLQQPPSLQTKTNSTSAKMFSKLFLAGLAASAVLT